MLTLNDQSAADTTTTLTPLAARGLTIAELIQRLRGLEAAVIAAPTPDPNGERLDQQLLNLISSEATVLRELRRRNVVGRTLIQRVWS